jgi:DNA-binding SARP family transcriptional activator
VNEQPVKFDLSVFGGAVLGREGAIVSPSLTRRPLMLLSLLACRGGSAGRRVSRDQLLVLLWPESREARARNSLNQALRAIRNVLGSDVIVGSTELALNPERIACDRWTFDDHMKRGEYEAAIAIRSAGPLLEGMSLPGLTELDEWVEAERRRVDEQYRNGIEGLASAMESRG